MKINKCLAATICSALFALAGCRPSTKPVFKVPPSLQGSYVDGGGLLQWAPTGKPFQIYWLNGQNPCSKSDVLSSDGNSVVTCHVVHGGVYGGSYAYDVDKPGNSDAKLAARNGVYFMHVGPCLNCANSGGSSPPNGPQSPALPQGSVNPPGNEVRISCPSPNTGATTQVVPPNGPTGLKVGDEVVFEFLGPYPQDTQNALTLTFPGNYCQGYSSKYVIKGLGGSCKVSSTDTVTYNPKAYGCNVNADAFLKAQ